MVIPRNEWWPRRYRLPEGRIIRRSRDWYLYDQNSNRYLDVWQADGSAFLGHRPEGYGALAKQEIDRGLWTALPTPWDRRLNRSLGELARAAGFDPDQRFEFLNGRDDIVMHRDRRWLPTGRIPDGGGNSPSLVVPAPGVTIPDGSSVGGLPAYQVALLNWGVQALTRYLTSSQCAQRERDAESLTIPPGYTRDGVWFVPDAMVPGDIGACRTELKAWEEVVEVVLACGVVLPPDPWTPLTVPGSMNRADIKRWERMCHDWPQ